MTQPKLRVRSSGFSGSGYAFPAIGDMPGKLVTNADSQKFKARFEDDGKTVMVFPGVTTVLKALDKPALEQWRADCVAAKAVANIDGLLARTKEEGYEYLRFASDDQRNDRAEKGTLIHEYIQADLGFGFYPEFNDPEVDEMIDAWERFRFLHPNIRAHWSERTMVNYDHRYAGTADLLLDIDDKVNVLIDIKSARHTYDDHYSQVVALDNCPSEFEELAPGEWVERPREHAEHLGVIHIRPDDYDTKGNFIDRFCRISYIDDRRRSRYWDLFRASLIGATARYELKELDKLDSVA